jgi:hypothetical protein
VSDDERIKKYFKMTDFNYTFEPFIDTEQGILCTLWTYVNQQPNKNEMITSFVDAIKETYQVNQYTEGLVCINGRIAQLMGSMAVLDMNGYGAYNTDQTIKNDCFHIASTVLNQQLSTLTEQQLQLYNDSSSDVVTTKFISDTKDKIKEAILSKYPEFNQHKLHLFINEACVAI